MIDDGQVDIQDELIAVEIKGKRGKPSTFVTEDEEYKKVNLDIKRKYIIFGTIWR